MATGTLGVTMYLDTGAFNKGIKLISSNLKEATNILNTMKNSLSLLKVDAIVNLTRQAIDVTRVVYNFGRSVSSLTNDLQKNAEIMGVSVESFQKLSYAAKMADVDNESFQMGMKFLARSIEEARDVSSEAARVFKVLGIEAIDPTTGYSKELETVTYELADAFKNAEQGTGKVDAAIKLLGRSGQSMIPFLNKGSVAIKEFGDEAVRMGTVMGDVIVQKGGMAEEQFKKLEIRINALKLSMAPVTLHIANIFTGIVDGFSKMINDISNIISGNEKAIELFMMIMTGGFIKGFKPPQTKAKFTVEEGTEEPLKKIIIPEKGKKEEEKMPKMPPDMWEYFQKAPGFIEIINDGIVEEVLSVNSLNEALEKEIKDRELLQDLYSSQYDIMKSIGTLPYEVPTEIEAARMEVESLNRELESTNDALREGVEYSKLMGQAWLESYQPTALQGIKMGLAQFEANLGTPYEQAKEMTEQFGRDLSNSFSTFFGNIISGTMSFKDAITSLWQSILNNIIKQASDVLGNLATKGITSGIGALLGLQHGGIVTRPTIAMIGESGPEAVIPLKEGKTQSSQPVVNYFHINAVDAPSFVELCRRQPAGFLSAFQRDMRSGGITRTSSRSYL